MSCRVGASSAWAGGQEGRTRVASSFLTEPQSSYVGPIGKALCPACEFRGSGRQKGRGREVNEEHLPGRTLQAGAAAQEGSETEVLSRQSKPGVGFKTCSKSNDSEVGRISRSHADGHGAQPRPLSSLPCAVVSPPLPLLALSWLIPLVARGCLPVEASHFLCHFTTHSPGPFPSPRPPLLDVPSLMEVLSPC